MFCSRCGTELSPQSACSHCGARTSRFRLPLLIALALALLGIGGWFASKFVSARMDESRLNAKLEEAIGRDAGYTQTILKIESEASSMTYGELFKVCEKSVEDRTNVIVELRGLYPRINSDLRNSLIDHLTAENELIRQKVAFYRKQLDFSSAIERYKDQLSDTPDSSYGWDYYWKQLTSIKTEATEAASEMASNGKEFIATYNSLVDREKTLSLKMKKAGLRFVESFSQFKDDNIKRAEESVHTAENFRI